MNRHGIQADPCPCHTPLGYLPHAAPSPPMLRGASRLHGGERAAAEATLSVFFFFFWKVFDPE